MSKAFDGDAESAYMFEGYKRASSNSFSESIKLLIQAVPNLSRVFANVGKPLRIPKSPAKLQRLLQHRAESNQIGRGYKIQWGVSRDVRPYQDGHIDSLSKIATEIKILFNLPTGQTCGLVEFPKGFYTCFYKEPIKSIYVHAEGRAL